MGEEIIESFPRPERSDRTSVVRLKTIRTENLGAEGRKFRVLATLLVRGKERQIGQMFVKELNLEVFKDPDSVVRETLEKYLWLKKHKLPVVPTLRYDPENHRFLMTDVSEGGKYVIIDKHNPLAKARIKIKNLEEVKRRLLSTSKKAFAKGEGVFLTADSFAVVVDQTTGKGRVLILDLVKRSYKISGGRSPQLGYTFAPSQAKAGAHSFIEKYLV